MCDRFGDSSGESSVGNPYAYDNIFNSADLMDLDRFGVASGSLRSLC